MKQVGDIVTERGSQNSIWIGIVVWVLGEDFRVDRWRLLLVLVLLLTSCLNTAEPTGPIRICFPPDTSFYETGAMVVTACTGGRTDE